MIRINRDSDLILTVEIVDDENNIIPIEEFADINIAIYTNDEQLAVIKTKADIKDNQVIIEKDELTTLPIGVVNVCYKLSVVNPAFGDGKMDTTAHQQTNYYLTNCIR